MRESIGAGYIFTICLTFILLITAYLAISVNYAKAFKIKSYIVSRIEENSVQKGQSWNNDVREDVLTYLTAQGYSAYGECPLEIEAENGDSYWAREECLNESVSGQCSVCIYQLGMDDSPNDEIEGAHLYYKVVTFFKFELPIVNNLFTFKISGDSKYIYEG